jgi:hypothetical protein
VPIWPVAVAGRAVLLHDLRDAEIQDLERPVVRLARRVLQEQILRLEVPVNHARFVRRPDGVSELVEQLHAFRCAERAPRDAVAQRLALEQLHREPRRAALSVDARGDHLDDVPASNRRADPRLLHEALDLPRLREQLGLQDLQRPRPPCRALPRHVERAHPAARELPLDHEIAANHRAGLQGFVRVHLRLDARAGRRFLGPRAPLDCRVVDPLRGRAHERRPCVCARSSMHQRLALDHRSRARSSIVMGCVCNLAARQRTVLAR